MLPTRFDIANPERHTVAREQRYGLSCLVLLTSMRTSAYICKCYMCTSITSDG